MFSKFVGKETPKEAAISVAAAGLIGAATEAESLDWSAFFGGGEIGTLGASVVALVLTYAIQQLKKLEDKPDDKPPA